jgi:AcrR family transcriptional regulator
MLEKQEKKRPRGRPRSFDEDAALDQVAEVFWAKGFDATSLDDVSAATGLGRPSIYNAFGDKVDLFLRSLGRYVDTVPSHALDAMRAQDTGQGAVAAFLRATAEYTTEDPSHPGCLLGSVAPTVDIPEVRAFVAKKIAWTQVQIQKRLTQAVEAGELPREYSPQRGARRAINGMVALAGRARLGATRRELVTESADMAKLVMAPT